MIFVIVINHFIISTNIIISIVTSNILCFIIEKDVGYNFSNIGMERKKGEKSNFR